MFLAFKSVLVSCFCPLCLFQFSLFVNVTQLMSWSLLLVSFLFISSHISVQDSFFSTLGLVSFSFCFMFISFKFPSEEIVLDLSKICVFVSFDVCSCLECV